MTGMDTAARVLLVEDDASIRRFVAMALEDLPIMLLQADSLAQARERLAEAPVALMLTDLMLPDGDGLDLLDGPARRHGRAIVLSAGVSPAQRARAEALGVWRVLDKPVSLADLLGAVEAALADAPADPGAAPVPDDAAPAGPAAVLDEAGAIARHFGGQAALYHAFRQACLAQFDADRTEGDDAVAAGDAARLRRLAHSLKSVLTLLGAEALAREAAAIEALAARALAAPPATDAPWARGWPALRDALTTLGAPGG